MSTTRVLAVLAVALLLIVGVRPAEACRCAPRSLRKEVAAAAAVFAGKVVAVDRQAITVEVAVVWKGVEVAAQVVLHDVTTMCALAPKVGDAMIFVPRVVDGGLQVQRCDANQPDGPRPRARVTRLLGKSHSPAP